MDNSLVRYVDEHLDETFDMLKLLCAQPSVSAQNEGILECAVLVRQLFEESGLVARLLPTLDERYPVVYGEATGDSPKTVLFYNHYDVQPPDPLEEWQSSPFDPVEKDGYIFARGVSDDKGHIVARLAAVNALLDIRGSLPSSVKFCVEGAEEIGSPGIQEFVENQTDLLKADACIWEGGGVNWEGQPIITLGVKGLVYVELECRTAATDAHSSYAPRVPNAAWRLAWALSTLKDFDETIRIRGFYEKVRPTSEQELAALQALPFEEDQLKQDLGVQSLLQGTGELKSPRSLYLSPTCNISGFASGYLGEGAKTIIPASARAKLDFRLVPDQDPNEIVRKLRSHLIEQGFGDIKVHVFSTEHPARTSLDHPWVNLVADAAKVAYGKEALLVPSMAGTGPMYVFQSILGVPVASCGVDYPGNHIHAPNENICKAYFRQGILHTLEVMDRFAVSEDA